MKQPARIPTERRIAAPLLAWLLALLLVLAQFSALMHRTLHGTAGEWQQRAVQGVDADAALTSSPSGVISATSHHASVDLFSHLWGSHDKRSDCQMFDQFGAAGLPVALLVLSSPLVPAVWRAPAPVVPATQFERFYSAQAPPVSI